MTICVGALAAGGRSIVCVADKAVAYGDHVTGETDATKIIPLPSGAVAMVSGDEYVFDRVLRSLNQQADLGKNLVKTLGDCEAAYQSARRELVDITYLKTNLMTEAQFVTASTGLKINPYISNMAAQIAAFKMDCSILLCGFDDTKTPYIINIEDPGQAAEFSRLGYHAIGSGFEYAVARLVWS